MSYEFKLADWKGPLEKLLELIEERKLNVNELSLAAVTGDFLKYLDSLRAEIFASGHPRPPEEDLRLLADFVVVAARLVLIKSKSLLPGMALTEEEEKGIQDLQARLAVYQKLRVAMRQVHREWRGEKFALARSYFMHMQSGASVFYPGDNLSREKILEAAGRIYTDLQKFALETQTVRETIISLEQKMQNILERMQNAPAATLSALSGNSKSDLVVAFLALLHLAREQLVHLEQAGAFSDIIVKKMKGTIGSTRPPEGGATR